MNKIIRNIRLEGDIFIPSSKSDGQRALLCAALSLGRTTISNLGLSDDERIMVHNIKLFGAKIKWLETDKIEVIGIGKFPEYLELNARESGLGLRLLGGVCATQKGIHHINARGSLLNRDQSFFEQNLNRYGLEVTSKKGKPPLVFKGFINTDNLEVDGSMSSQYISGLLIGLSFCNSEKKISVRGLNSTPYVDMTLNTMKYFGLDIENNSYKDFIISNQKQFIPCEYSVESDWSSASYWLAAAAIGYNIRVFGLNSKTKQADVCFLDALKLAGCNVINSISSYTVNSAKLKSFNFDATNCPDLFPALVVLASKCSGKTEIKGVSRLVNKESNRGVVIKHEFGKLGVNIELREDVMIIQGHSNLNSAIVDSNNDHRIAMSLAIIGSTIDGGIEIENAEAISKSYPEFWNHFDKITVS